MRPLTICTLMVGLGLVAATNRAFPASDEARTVSETAVARTAPPGAPGYSDVCMRSLFPRPNRWAKEGETDPHDTLKTAKAFGVTRLEWIYTRGDRDFAQQCREQGIHLNSTLITEAPMSSIKGYQVDLHGEYVTRWTKHGQGCANHPEYFDHYLSQARSHLQTGIGGFQVDNAGLNNAARCYCEHCIAGFRNYLEENVPAEEWATLGLGEVVAFDYRQYLLKKEGADEAEASEQGKGPQTGTDATDDGYRWAKDGQTLDIKGAQVADPSQKLRELFVGFQRNASVEFHKKAREAIDRIAGRYVPMSCNNGSGGWGDVQRIFDYGIGELRPGEANPWHLRHAFMEAARLGKHQVVTMPKPNCGTSLARRVIATAYANGGQMLVPWDIFLGPTKRYYGKPDRYADLYHFVRDNAALFDGYEDAAAIGKDLEDPRYPEGKGPVSLGSDSEDVFAFVRAQPGKNDAPVVVHLVDWSRRPQPFKAIVRPNLFFGDRPLRIRLLMPKHEDQILGEGRTTTVAVPALNPWGVLVVEPADDAGVGRWQPVITPRGGAIVETTRVSIASSSKGAEIRYTLDGTEPVATSTLYDGPISIDGPCTIRARTVDAGGALGAEAEALFTGPLSPASLPELAGGLKYRFYEKHGHSVPRAFGKLVKSGVAPGFDLSSRTRDRSYAFRFSGYIDVPRTGLYTFYLNSDDGSRLTIGGREVVDNDYIRGEPAERSGTIALVEGMHTMGVDYFVWISKPHLELSWQGPGIQKQPVPESAYYHAK